MVFPADILSPSTSRGVVNLAFDDQDIPMQDMRSAARAPFAWHVTRKVNDLAAGFAHWIPSLQGRECDPERRVLAHECKIVTAGEHAGRSYAYSLDLARATVVAIYCGAHARGALVQLFQHPSRDDIVDIIGETLAQLDNPDRSHPDFRACVVSSDTLRLPADEADTLLRTHFGIRADLIGKRDDGNEGIAILDANQSRLMLCAVSERERSAFINA